MDEMTNASYDAIVKYFTSLSQFGYKSYDDVYKLLALLTLNDIIDIFSEYVCEKDLRSIINAVYCLSGTTCLIDFPKYFNDDTLFHKTKVNYATRITEDNIIRYTQDNIIRLEA